ncbi:MAG TPA: aspartate carbamoyltransferase [Anaerovoracaceae bacterium]|nr:aspartate carbamoyltransferase [Anaerovoracaceae bacterium]
MLKGRNLLEPGDFLPAELEEIFELAEKIMDNPAAYARVCEGKLLSTLFFEPSTRTRLSFEAAMLRLGGQVIGFSEAGSSSTMKGESIADTIQTVSYYADIIAMRHPKEGAPKVGAGVSNIPLINAGDGGHQHPTQTLTDLMTILHAKGSFNNLTIGFCGDLKFGRTVHSLLKALSFYEDIKFILISPEELVIPDFIRKEVLLKKRISFEEVRRLEDVIGRLDILYMTRVQKERFFNEEDYVRLKDSYILNGEKMNLAAEDMIILHPLPRVNEISPEVDKDPRAMYFNQARYGMYVRMALIMKLLGVDIDEKGR